MRKRVKIICYCVNCEGVNYVRLCSTYLFQFNTHSIQGFSFFFIKQYYLSQYTTQCSVRRCYICNNWFTLLQCIKLISTFLLQHTDSIRCNSCQTYWCRLCHDLAFMNIIIVIHHIPIPSRTRPWDVYCLGNEICKCSIGLNHYVHVAYSGLD